MLSLQISFTETGVWSAFCAHLHAIKYKLHKYYMWFTTHVHWIGQIGRKHISLGHKIEKIYECHYGFIQMGIEEDISVEYTVVFEVK